MTQPNDDTSAAPRGWAERAAYAEEWARGARSDVQWTRVFLFVFCALAVIVTALLTYFYLQRPESGAAALLGEALLRSERADAALSLYQATVLQYNVRLLIALRFLGMFIGAQCILIGALFLLKGIETNYQFQLHAERASSSLHTSSPGLVLITLGVALVALTQLRDQELVLSAASVHSAKYVPSDAAALRPAASATPDGGAPPAKTALVEPPPSAPPPSAPPPSAPPPSDPPPDAATSPVDATDRSEAVPQRTHSRRKHSKQP